MFYILYQCSPQVPTKISVESCAKKENGTDERCNAHEREDIVSHDGDSTRVDSNATELFKNSTALAPDNIQSSSGSESELEDDFNPELFGLIENPGVMRFDYPLPVLENNYCDEEYTTVNEHTNGCCWIRISCDDLFHDIDDSMAYVKSDSEIISRSLEDVVSLISHNNQDN